MEACARFFFHYCIFINTFPCCIFLKFIVLDPGPERNTKFCLNIKALQLPANCHFKLSAAKTCSHNMFMKCQMLQNTIVTVPCTRYTSVPNIVPILSSWLPPLSNICFSSNSQSPCPATTLLALQQRSHLSRSSFFKAVFVQASPPHKPFWLQGFSTPPHPLVPDLFVRCIFTFSSLALSLLLFHSLSVPPVVPVTLPASPRPKPAKVPPSARWLLRAHRGLQSTTMCNHPDPTVAEETCSPWKNIFEGTKPQSAAVSTKYH